MEGLIKSVEELRKDNIAEVISSRIEEFESVLEDELFDELCFCLMTANFRADKCLEIQKEIGDGFHTLSQDELAMKLKGFGHRFWPQRAERIVLARKHKDFLPELNKMESIEARDWLVKNVKGLGMKESSHFLRNVGHKEVAIIDFHIIDLLNREGLINFEKKGLSHKDYFEIEKVLKDLSCKLQLSLAELDLFLWYLETGKVLK